MTPLERLELRIIELHNGLSLRPTLERAAQIGELLLEVKASLEHGQFRPWCRRLPFGKSTVAVYMKAANVQRTGHLPEHVPIAKFLRLVARHRYVQPSDPTEDAPEEAQCRVVQSDCREYDWPPGHLIVADPPWKELWAYDWLATFARDKLKDGGLLLCQCGIADLPDQTERLRRHLTYKWTLGFNFKGSNRSKPYWAVTPTWRPVILLVKGRCRDLKPVTDMIEVQGCEKIHHDWQQPTKPFSRWLGAWTRPGQVVLDPFAGSGSIGVVVKALGGRSYLGTEIDPGHVKTARKRICGVKPGSGWQQDHDD